jgi:prolyl-tRNA synthetase
MSRNLKTSKTDFTRFVMSVIEHDSFDKDNAKEYLSSQGLDVGLIVSEGLKKIKRLELQIQAERTKNEMILSEEIKQKANKWVGQLLSNSEFSLKDLIKEEELSLCFRNIENLKKEDIKEILVKHFTLKFLRDQEANGL